MHDTETGESPGASLLFDIISLSPVLVGQKVPHTGSLILHHFQDLLFPGGTVQIMFMAIKSISIWTVFGLPERRCCAKCRRAEDSYNRKEGAGQQVETNRRPPTLPRVRRPIC